MSWNIRMLCFLFLILAILGCKKKKLKVIKVPTGQDIYFEDDTNPGGSENYVDNLINSFTVVAGGDNFINDTFHYLTIEENFEYYENNTATTTISDIAIIDPVLNLTYIYKEARVMPDGEPSLGNGVFIVLTNATITPIALTPDPAPPILPRDYVYIGITLKSSGASLYITETVKDSTLINWSFDFIADSRQRSIEDMWLKNAQDNRVEELTIKNSARVIEDNYLLIYVYDKAITPSRAIYRVFNTIYYIGIEYKNAGKEIYLSYSGDDIQNGNMLTSPDDIDWNDMTFVGYSTRILGGVDTAPSLIVDTHEEDILEPISFK